MAEHIKNFINKIFNEDCLITIDKMPDDSIDIILTSPPYNIGNCHTNCKKHYPYFDNLPEIEYQNNQIRVLNEIYRITKKEGSLLYNHKNRIKNKIQITPYEWIFKTKWIVKQELVWFNGSPNFDKQRFYPMTERIYWLVKNKETTLNNVISHHDLFKWNSEGTNKEHTRTFPLKMVLDILSCFPDSNIVYDPYCGSGTTLVGAKELGKKYIGSEINKNYCELSMRNLSLVSKKFI